MVNCISLFTFLMTLGTANVISWPLDEKKNIVMILVLSLGTIVTIPWFIKKPKDL